MVGKVEKGVDTAIATDLLTLAWQRDYDVAVLVTSDADFVPAVERIQDRGLKVINAGWRNKGHELKKASSASFDIDTIAEALRR
ncbi:MAG: NYN domain-containing protein [Mycobacteriales bacterium]